MEEGLHPEKKYELSLFDFSELEESGLFLDASYVPTVHADDEKYLHRIIRHHRQNLRRVKHKDTAECTDFPESMELRQKTFKVSMRYRKKTVTFDGCRWNTMLSELVVRTLISLEPMDLSCSWLTSNPEDYVVQLGNRKEYVYDHHLRLSLLVYVRNCISRGEKIECTLIEKSGIAARTSSFFDISRDEHEYIGLPLPVKTRKERCIPSYRVQKPLLLKIYGVNGMDRALLKDFTSYSSYNDISFSLEVGLRCGREEILSPLPLTTFRYEDVGDDLTLTLMLPLFLSDLPRETSLLMYINAKREAKTLTQRFVQSWIFMEPTSLVRVGWGECSIYDFQGCLRSQPVCLSLWCSSDTISYPHYLPAHPSPKGKECVVADVKFSLAIEEDENEPIFFAHRPRESKPRKRIKPRDWEKIQSGKASDTILWKYRRAICAKSPELFLPLLKTVHWSDGDQVREIHEILRDLPLLYPFAGFEILALETADLKVRAYAVRCLQNLSDKEVQACIPQLIQTLKWDTYLSSPLATFLLLRALSKDTVGHTFFWYLSSEMDDIVLKHRFAPLKQCYLEGISPTERKSLLKMEKIMKKLIRIADHAQGSYTKTSAERLQSWLYEVTFPDTFYLPTNSKVEVRALLVEECFVLGSKTQPLWLTFEAVNGQKVYLILKVGDDIRVDVLALQMMNILDSFWKKEGLDLHLQPYVALPLGKRMGLIEVASKSETTSTINWKYGGSSFASAFSSTSLKAYLYKNNLPSEREQALRNFALSCAGYCVFTYVFGVGDRHGDNILCTKKGNLFHIDFGYFLGERSTFLGFSRETNFFVLTPNYIHTMDKFFDLFVALSCQGFVIAQHNESTFTTLIRLMIPCGEDVLTEDQVNYVKAALEPWLSEKEGKRKFYNIIQRSLQDKRTLLNDFAHLIATKKRI